MKRQLTKKNKTKDKTACALTILQHFWDRQPIAIAMSVCRLARCVLWLNGAR